MLANKINNNFNSWATGDNDVSYPLGYDLLKGLKNRKPIVQQKADTSEKMVVGNPMLDYQQGECKSLLFELVGTK
jgi:hypothetical protein